MDEQPKPQPHLVLGEPSDPSLSKASPLSYQAAASNPPPPRATHELKADLPQSGSGCIATVSLAPRAQVIYSPLIVPDDPQTTATASGAAYPPSYTSPAKL